MVANEPERLGREGWWRRGLLIGLIVVAHRLFFDHAVGLSLAVYAMLIALAVMVLRGRRPGLADLWLMGGLVLAALPVAERVQPLSIAFLVAGLAVTVCGLVLDQAGPVRLVQAALRLIGSLAVAGPRDLLASRHQLILPDHAGFVRGWGMPLVVASLFALMLTGANPVLEGWLIALTDRDIGLGDVVARVLFWSLTALLVWPFLSVARHQARLLRPVVPVGISPVDTVRLGFNATSVMRALVMFNLLFAAQTVMDGSYLWGGAALPDGMSHASYAHRGAYPLLATALLAGVFALMCRPHLDDRRGLRGLLILWLGQTVGLMASSILRIDLYVDAYGLTYLRMFAAIWMALVAVGLVLTGWQIWARRSNTWLLVVNAGVGLATLYVCCFVNFAALIAMDGRARLAARERVDMAYLCNLGPDAAGYGPMTCGSIVPTLIADWRDWGFRAARIQGNLGPLWQDK